MIKQSAAVERSPYERLEGRGLPPANVFIKFKREEVEQSIQQRFERMVSLYPRRTAVKTQDETLTYEELNNRVNRIAGTLLECRGSKAEPIVLFLEKGAAAIASILGVLKAGKIYVPISVSTPRKRMESMLEDCQSPVILTNGKNLPAIDESPRASALLINVDEINYGLPAENPRASVSPAALAYILYTSGSTGQPKGLVQNHRNVLHNTMSYTNILHLCPEDRLTLLHSCSYGASINNLYGALLNGGALLPFDIEEEGIAKLPEFILGERITVYHSVPAVFRNFVSHLIERENFPDLRFIHLSGAPASKKDVELYKKYFSSDCIFVHRLGSTEANSVFFYLAYKNSKNPSHVVPVGYPVEDKKVALLDENGAEVEVNRTGEIVVKSKFLSPGYWRDPCRTQAAFLPDPEGGEERVYKTGDLGRMRPDGSFEHLGRIDSRVKIRGYRIELTEIEMALIALENIKDAAVVVREDKADEKRLVAYIVPEANASLNVTVIRRTLGETLPEYMIPPDFVFLDTLPLTPNGKLDKNLLPDPGPSRPGLDTPLVVARTPMEKELARIWTEILDKDYVGVDDNFFDLGGHSLLATQVLSRIRDRLDVEISLPIFFDKPTIAQLAQVISESKLKKT